MKVITFTEDQKRIIESQGIMVIEYKRMIYFNEKVIEISIQRMSEIFENIVDLIQTTVDALADMLESVSKSFSSLESCKTFNLPRYPMIRQYNKCKTPDKNLIWKPRVKARSRL